MHMPSSHTARAPILPTGAKRPTQHRALAIFARYVSEIARLHPETDTWDEDLASFSAKSMHFAQTLPGRRLFSRNRQKENTRSTIIATWNDYCHIAQNDLKGTTKQ